MKNKEKVVLQSILGEFFKDNFYVNGIENLRNALKLNKYYIDSWKDLIRVILRQNFQYGDAKNLIYEYANVPLHEDTEEEAYKWLTLMIINVQLESKEQILEYNNFLDPEYFKIEHY